MLIVVSVQFIFLTLSFFFRPRSQSSPSPRRSPLFLVFAHAAGALFRGPTVFPRYCRRQRFSLGIVGHLRAPGGYRARWEAVSSPSPRRSPLFLVFDESEVCIQRAGPVLRDLRQDVRWPVGGGNGTSFPGIYPSFFSTRISNIRSSFFSRSQPYPSPVFPWDCRPGGEPPSDRAGSLGPLARPCAPTG